MYELRNIYAGYEGSTVLRDVSLVVPDHAVVALVGGFGGLRHFDGTVSFAPRLPEGLTRLAFTLLIRGRRLRVEVTQAEARYSLADGEPLEILHHGATVRLSAGKPQHRRLPVTPTRPRPSQPPGREPVHRRPTGDDS